MITRKNEMILACPSAFIIQFFDFLDELLYQVENAISSPDAFPEVGCSEALPRRRITSPTITAFVERQETSRRPFEMRCHVNKVWVNRKMSQAAAKGEKRFTRVAIKAILLNSILDILSCEWIL